jgi:hypothetical protein
VFGRNKSGAGAPAEPAAEPGARSSGKPGGATRVDGVSPTVVRPAGKGRPTPSRREAEQRNRQPLVGSPRLSPNATKQERKAARAAQRDATAAERVKTREAMFNGDEKHLPAQHRGPARRFARDYVDARRNLGDYLMPIGIVILALGVVPRLQLIGVPLLYLYVIAVVVDGFLLSRRVNRIATEKFGATQAAGVGRYAAFRSAQIRRFRMPRPQVKRGQYPE